VKAEMGVVTIRKAEISIALQIIAGSPVTTEEAQKEITPRNTALLMACSLV
jgi:hypothetical protein